MEGIVKTLKGHETYDWEYGMRPFSSYPLLNCLKVPHMIGVPKAKAT